MIVKKPVEVYIQKWIDLLHEEDVETVEGPDTVTLYQPAGTDKHYLERRERRIFEIMEQVGFYLDWEMLRDYRKASRGFDPDEEIIYAYVCHIPKNSFNHIYYLRAADVAHQWAEKLHTAMHYAGIPEKEISKFAYASSYNLTLILKPTWEKYIPGLTNPIALPKVLPEFQELREQLGKLPKWRVESLSGALDKVYFYSIIIDIALHPEMISPY